VVFKTCQYGITKERICKNFICPLRLFNLICKNVSHGPIILENEDKNGAKIEWNLEFAQESSTLQFKIR
jgi:hypothetical protein